MCSVIVSANPQNSKQTSAQQCRTKFMLNWAFFLFHLVATRNVTETAVILLPISTEHLMIQDVVPFVQCHILYAILHQRGILHMVVPWHSRLVAGL